MERATGYFGVAAYVTEVGQAGGDGGSRFCRS